MSSCTPLHAPMRHRSLFLSDLHLGSRACQADKLLNFLYQHEAHYIYLVGDIFDVWHPRAVHWTPDHERIIDLLRSREQQGVKIVRLPGNHDPVHVEKQNGFAHTALFTATQKTVVHEGADGRRYLVLHGDCCDFWPLSTHLFSRLGSGIDWCWRRRKEPYRAYAPADPFSAKTQRKTLAGHVGALFKYRSLIEQRLTALAHKQDADGIICGHLHSPALHIREGVMYANCGDWISNMSAIVEDAAGEFSLINGALASRINAAPVHSHGSEAA